MCLRCATIGIDGYLLEKIFLAPGQDRVRYLVYLRGGEDEDDVGRRLFEGLQEGVEGLLGEHVHFVDDVDLVPGFDRGEIDVFPQLADVVDAAVGGAVDLDHVEGRAVPYLPAVVALAAGVRRRARLAVEGLCQDARHGGLAHAARSGKKIGVGNAPLLNAVLQCLGYMVLEDDLVEVLGTPFSGSYLVGHGFVMIL